MRNLKYKILALLISANLILAGIPAYSVDPFLALPGGSEIDLSIDTPAASQEQQTAFEYKGPLRWEDLVGYDKEEKKYFMVQGRYVSSGGESRSFTRVMRKVWFNLSHDIGKSLDNQVDNELTARDIIREYNGKIKLLEERISKVSGFDQAKRVKECLNARAEIIKIRELMHSPRIPELISACSCLDKAVESIDNEQFNDAVELLGKAQVQLLSRIQAIEQIIQKIEQGRLRRYRNIINQRNHDFLKVLDASEKLIRKRYYSGARGILVNLASGDLKTRGGIIMDIIPDKQRRDILFDSLKKSEPEFEGLSGVLFDIMGKFKGKNPNIDEIGPLLERVKQQILEARIISVFMEKFRDRFVYERRMDQGEQCREQVFRQLYADFVFNRNFYGDSPGELSDILFCSPWLYPKLYLLAYKISLHDPKFDRGKNPLFSAVDTLSRLQAMKSFEIILKARGFFPRGKNEIRAAVENISKKHKDKPYVYRMSPEERKKIIEAIIGDYELDAEQAEFLNKSAFGFLKYGHLGEMPDAELKNITQELGLLLDLIQSLEYSSALARLERIFSEYFKTEVGPDVNTFLVELKLLIELLKENSNIDFARLTEDKRTRFREDTREINRIAHNIRVRLMNIATMFRSRRVDLGGISSRSRRLSRRIQSAN